MALFLQTEEEEIEMNHFLCAVTTKMRKHQCLLSDLTFNKNDAKVST